jgi:hypothetical protein
MALSLASRASVAFSSIILAAIKAVPRGYRKGDVGEHYRQNTPFVNFRRSCDDILQQAKNDSRISYTIIYTLHLMLTPLIRQGELLRQQHKFITAS